MRCTSIFTYVSDPQTTHSRNEKATIKFIFLHFPKQNQCHPSKLRFSILIPNLLSNGCMASLSVHPSARDLLFKSRADIKLPRRDASTYLHGIDTNLAVLDIHVWVLRFPFCLPLLLSRRWAACFHWSMPEYLNGRRNTLRPSFQWMPSLEYFCELKRDSVSSVSFSLYILFCNTEEISYNDYSKSVICSC